MGLEMPETSQETIERLERERDEARAQLNEILESTPVSTCTTFAGDIPVYVKAVMGVLQDKANAYDLDRAGIEARDAEAAELVRLRAENQDLLRKMAEMPEVIANWLDEQSAERDRKAKENPAQRTRFEEQGIVLARAADDIRHGAPFRKHPHK